MQVRLCWDHLLLVFLAASILIGQVEATAFGCYHVVVLSSCCTNWFHSAGITTRRALPEERCRIPQNQKGAILNSPWVYFLFSLKCYFKHTKSQKVEQPGTGCRKQHNTLHIADLWLKPLLLLLVIFSAFTWAANILSMIFCRMTSQLVLSGQAKPVAPWMVNVEQLQALLWINDSVSSCWA